MGLDHGFDAAAAHGIEKPGGGRNAPGSWADQPCRGSEFRLEGEEIVGDEFMVGGGVDLDVIHPPAITRHLAALGMVPLVQLCAR